MTDISRRLFLGGTLALGATAIVRPQLLLGLPQIYADGIHDDADGLNALFARKPVNLVSDLVHVKRTGRITLRGGIFKLTKTVFIDNGLHPEGVLIQNGEFRGNVDGPLFYFKHRNMPAVPQHIGGIVFADGYRVAAISIDMDADRLSS